MKPLYTRALATALLFWTVNAPAQTTFPYTEKADAIFQNLDKTPITTGILFDRAAPLSRFDLYNPMDDTVDYEMVTQTYYELYQSAYQRTNLLDPSTLGKMVAYENARARIPIVVLDYLYNKMETTAIQDGLFTYDAAVNTLHDVAGRPRSPYLTQHLQMAAPLVEEVRSNTVTFVLLPHFISRNTGLNVQQVSLDFGSGPQVLDAPVDSITVTFPISGAKEVVIATTLSNGSSFSTRCHIIIGGSNYSARTTAVSDPCRTEPVRANDAFQGYDESQSYQGYFEAHYYYRTNAGASCDGSAQTLNKPIIIIDGFDPTDARGPQKLYTDYLKYIDDVTTPNSPTEVDMVEELRSLGYDVIIVNLPAYAYEAGGTVVPVAPNTQPSNFPYHLGKVIVGGSDYVERNAFTLITLINQINQRLAAQGSQEKLVIIGPSMGGQISRFALKWMENNGQNHNCRLWVSFDSNHEGAIVPSGEQLFFDWAAGLSNKLRATKELILDCPAAKQFVLNHYLYNKTTGSLDVGGAPGFFNRYYQTLDALGWPQQCRKIAMISGGEKGNPLPIPQASQMALNLNVALGRGGFLLALICDLFSSSNCRLLDITMYTAPPPNTIGDVAELKIPLLNARKVWQIRGSNLTRSQSLEVVQSGFYWGYKELVSIGTATDLPKFLKKTLQINMPAGYHSHQPTAGTLAYGKGINPTIHNFKWDDDVTPYNLGCDGYSPFDFYFGPGWNSVKHDSLFYYQAKVLIEEIQGVLHDNRKPFRATIGTDYVTGAPWCVGQTQTFSVLNSPPGVGFNWAINHTGLEIIGGQGTPQITVLHSNPNVPSVQVLVTAAGSSLCYDYEGSLRMIGTHLFNQAEIGGWWTSGGRTAAIKYGFRDLNIIPETTTAQVYMGADTRNPNDHYPYTNITYALLNNPPINYSWSQSNGVLTVSAPPTQDPQNALHFRVSYGSVCDASTYSKEFSLFFADVRMRTIETSGAANELVLGNNGLGQALDVEVYDAKGSLLRRQKGYIVNKQLKTDLGNVANGLYFLKAKTKQGLLVQKVVVNK